MQNLSGVDTFTLRTANVLNQLLKSSQAKARTDVQNIWMAKTRKQADKPFDHFTDNTMPMKRLSPV